MADDVRVGTALEVGTELDNALDPPAAVGGDVPAAPELGPGAARGVRTLASAVDMDGADDAAVLTDAADVEVDVEVILDSVDVVRSVGVGPRTSSRTLPALSSSSFSRFSASFSRF